MREVAATLLFIVFLFLCLTSGLMSPGQAERGEDVKLHVVVEEGVAFVGRCDWLYNPVSYIENRNSFSVTVKCVTNYEERTIWVKSIGPGEKHEFTPISRCEFFIFNYDSGSLIGFIPFVNHDG